MAPTKKRSARKKTVRARPRPLRSAKAQRELDAASVLELRLQLTAAIRRFDARVERITRAAEMIAMYMADASTRDRVQKLLCADAGSSQ